ncbi:F-box protein [Pyrus ussuriensis x Pyrus communis]|uniref:F-box protein n=1 Tax=Pyrus ussuriensis x Pyrus communis TaxID=2448454 RepID=A0A5N5FI88_9ROSA|nr:F-box protein [Pyrus ussuriensis x Pyrus communis]
MTFGLHDRWCIYSCLSKHKPPQLQNDEERQTMKKGRVMKKGTTTPTFIQSLLNELLLGILTRLVPAPYIPYIQKNWCTRSLTNSSNMTCIFEHISIRRFERVDPLTSQRRHEEVYKFLEWCIEWNNPEALYTQGMQWYFQYNNSELGIDYLKTVISKGHQASMYVYGALAMQGRMKKKEASALCIL